MSYNTKPEIQEIFLATLNNCCCNPKNICENCFFRYDHNSPRNKVLTFDIHTGKDLDSINQNKDYIVPEEQGHLIDW